MNAARRTVCLSMIVRDEAKVIRRCLDSVRPLIDHWVIVDTGSVDGTQDVVREHLRDIPGELHERPWRDFGHNRTEALELARGKADYLLIIDADEVLEVDPSFEMPVLDQDSYRILTRYAGHSYYRTQLVRSELDFRYEGVLHEVITSPRAKTEGTLDGVANVPHTDGARSADPRKYERDAEVLERALETEPGNARYAFYLAQSYRDAGLPEKAIAAYRRRADMGGWEEEVWYSLFQIAALEERRGSFEAAVMAYLVAYQRRPSRAEPLCALARLYRERREFVLAHLFASRIARAPRPGDILFLDDSVYDWRALDEYAIAAFYVGQRAEGLAANDELLRSRRLPHSERERVEANRRFCLGAESAGARDVGATRDSGNAGKQSKNERKRRTKAGKNQRRR